MLRQLREFWNKQLPQTTGLARKPLRQPSAKTRLLVEILEDRLTPSMFGENFDLVAAGVLPVGWTVQTPTGTPVAVWTTRAVGSDTAPNVASVALPGNVADTSLLTPVIRINSTTSQLSFRHSRSFELGFDGGVLEVSINGGAFTDIITAGGSFVGGNYSHTISSSFSSPIAGRQAWSGTSAMITTTINLPASMANTNVQFRWRAASDSSALSGNPSWSIDTVLLRDDNAENFDFTTTPALPAGWSSTTAGGTNWVTTATGSNSAPNNVFAPNPGVTSDTRLISPLVNITAATNQLSFRHNFAFESGGWDGGVLEISINNGAFTDIVTAGGSFVWGGYNGTINSGTPNPLTGRAGWINSSGGYDPLGVVVNLPGAAIGQNVRFQWRLGADDVFGATGWNVDTVSLTTGITNNDMFANAFALAGATATGTSNNTGFTGEVGEPNPFADTKIQSAWWHWTAPFTGTTTLTTVGSNFNTTLAAYTGAAVNALTLVASNDDGGTGITPQSKITFAAAAGTKYYFATDGFTTAQGKITLNLNHTNTAPSNIVITPPAGGFNEGAAGNINVTFTDPDTLDPHTIEIDWDGDGTFDETFNLGAGVLSFSKSHVFADDNPTGTSSDPNTIIVRVTDGNSNKATGSQATTIKNVAPSAFNLTLDKASLNEGQAVTLGGSFTDPGILDTFTVMIDWGDGNVESVNLGAGVTSFSGITHTYDDDNPSGTASDDYTISVTVTDDDLGAIAKTATVTVNNVAPSALTLDAVSYSINEGDKLTISGTFVDPGAGDPHLVHIDWDGDGTFDQSFGLAPGVTSFSFTKATPYLDDANLSINVRVDDDDLGKSSVVSATVEVKNVAPSNLLLNVGSINENQAFTLNGSFVDPGVLDTHDVEIDWNGDGTFDQTVNLAAGVLTFSATSPVFLDDSPTGTPFDITTVKVRVTDKDAGQTKGQTTVTVNNVAPTIASSSLDKTTINENEAVTLTINFNDPGSLDTHTVDIDWEGDGVFDETFVLALGDRSFTKTHVYLDDTPGNTPQDTYFIKYRITDDDTGVLDATVPVGVTVNNVAPTFVSGSLDKLSINENEAVTLTINFNDPGSLDTHTVDIDWEGDGIFDETFVLLVGERSFTKTHVYLDDNPSTGTPQDTYFIKYRITDDDTGLLNDTVVDGVTVKNVAPSNLLLNGPFTINENDSIVLTGSFTDPGSLDEHFVDIDWDGDGTYDQTLSLLLGARNFSVTHQYLDDLPTGSPVDMNNINVRVRDDDTGEVTGNTSVTVNNVNPNNLILNGPFTINENGIINLTGSFMDAGSQDTHTVEIDWDGDGVFDQTINLSLGARNFSVSHQYLDDNPTGTKSDTNTINVRVTDDDTGVGTAASAVTVNNLNPVLGITGPNIGVIGVPLKFTANFSDIGSLDTHEISVNWGDGQTDPFTTVTSPTDMFHSFTKLGNVTVTFTLRDDDGGLSVVNHTLNVSNVGTGVDICDPMNFGLKSLYVSGTDRNDVITFVPNLRGGVSVILNGRVFGPFFPNAHVIAFGQGGNDRISVHPSLSIPAIFYGGAGHDVLVGSRGNDLLYGQDGNDTMIGAHGRDVLIGGFGADTLYGHFVVQKPSGRDDQDLLIGNATTFDNTPTVACMLADDWFRTDLTFEERREMIRTGAGSTPALDLNNIIEDNARDRLFSVRSTDWLFRDGANLDRFFGPIATQLN